MKVTKEKRAEHRTHIIAAAARLFREHGFDHVTVADVMQEAGLTHGAFYGHFPSKDALIAEAVIQKQDQSNPPRPAADYADGYLSPRHRDNRAASCPFSSLGTEASRGSAELRRKMTESIRHRIDHLAAEAAGATPAAKRRAAIAAWSAMIGAMVLARIADDETLSNEILAETRASLPLRPAKTPQNPPPGRG